MNPLVAIGAAIGYLAAPRLAKLAATTPRPFLNTWNEQRPRDISERGASITFFGREVCVEILTSPKGGE